MYKKDILAKLRRITSSSLAYPYWGLPKSEFARRSYTKWAVEEVLKAIEKSDLPPIMVAESFSKRMDDYACMKERNSIMFSVAHDTAEWIVNLLLS